MRELKCTVNVENFHKVVESFDPLVDGYMKNKHLFASMREIRGGADQHIMKVCRQGNHRKILGKKMRAKIDGHIDVEHLRDKKTYVIRRIELDKKKVWVNCAVINYFSASGGIIYALRGSVSPDDLYFFTAHFFDRLAERGYDKSPLNRTDVVKTFLLDFAVAQMGIGFTLWNPDTMSSKIYLGHGVAIGECVPIPGERITDPVMNVHKVVTYLSLDMIHPELLAVFKKGGTYVRENPGIVHAVMKHI